MGAAEILTHHVIPIMGLIVNIFLYLAPTKSVIHVKQTGKIGDLNALPFSFTVFSSIVWTVYGVLLKDFYIFLSSALGILIGAFNALTCLPYMRCKEQLKLEYILLSMAALTPVLGFTTTFIVTDHNVKTTMWGICASCIGMMYYVAPLTTIATIVKTRNSASILLPMVIMNTINTTLWGLYGLAIGSMVMYIPNCFSFTVSMVQIALHFIYPPKKQRLELDSSLPPIKSDLEAAHKLEAELVPDYIHHGYEPLHEDVSTEKLSLARTFTGLVTPSDNSMIGAVKTPLIITIPAADRHHHQHLRAPSVF